MQELVDYLVSTFIPRESYDLVAIEDNDDLEIKVMVDKANIAKIIGRGGRVAKAIRTLVRVKSMATGQKCFVTIEDR